MSETKEDRAAAQAQAQFDSIRDLVAALECDYDRLEELREERKQLVEEVTELRAAYDEAAKAEDAAQNQAPDADYDLAKTAEDKRTAWEEKIEELAEWDADNGEEYQELREAAGDCADQDEARERIQEDALSVEVRSDWTTLGKPLEASEYCILLCTGGPAARIVGDLGRGEPTSARLEYQDWGTPWTEFVNCERDTLLSYARCFYFGE
jgi:DNA repair exonuclease SbcCD ATPase subunit